MAIKIHQDKIEFVDGASTYTLTETAEGFDFSGSLAAAQLSTFQGEVAGFTSGGRQTPISPALSDVIDRFPFSTDSNATDVGNLTVARHTGLTGTSSSTHGYTAGGFYPEGGYEIYSNIIDRFPFAANANASDVGDLTIGRYGAAGQSSLENGYTSGGSGSWPAPTSPITQADYIDKFPFASNNNATDVGNLTQKRTYTFGQSSSTNGYTCGGSTPNFQNTIDKFPFATNSNASDVGDLTVARDQAAGQSSTTHGYSSGGSYPDVDNTIDKFPFASDANATNVGDLTAVNYRPAGQSSFVSGYTSGGRIGTDTTNTIDKFPFAVDTNATDVGDLTVARYHVAGQQD